MAQTLRGSGLGENWSLPRIGGWSASARFVLLAFVAAGSWLPLTWWYSLPANQANTHFAFEKIPGRFASPILPATLLLFLVLSAVYAAGYVLLTRLPAISFPVKLAVVLMIAVPAVANIFIYPVGALDVLSLIHI